MWIYEERTKTERKQTNAKKDDNSVRMSKLLMLMTLLSAPWWWGHGARPLTLFDLPVKNGKSGGSSLLSCVPFT